MFASQNKFLWIVSVLVLSIMVFANGYQYFFLKKDLTTPENILSTPYGTINTAKNS